MMESRGFPFTSVARRSPDRPAVRLGGRTVGYRELDELSGSLAARIAPGRTVAVTGRDRLDHVVGLLAALRAGATYLPLDRDAPEERNRWIREDAGATLAYTDGELVDLGPAASGGSPGSTGVPGADASATAGYLVYTSGTTGRPKGVHVPLAALTGHLAAAVERFGLTADDVVLHFARPTVDVAVEQVLAALTAGACVVVPEQQLVAPAALLDLLDDEGVTVANLAAGYFQDVVAALRERGRAPRTLRLMISGSDRLYPDTAAGWWAATGVPLLNAYGPTETVITATVHASAGPAAGVADVVPIGGPLGDRRAYVLDDRLRPVLPGAAGELYLGGPLLASGYHGRPGLTAGRFVADPFTTEPGARMYRTGDQARRSAEGLLEYVGRVDRQVKLRGFRVELGEVEHALAALDGVTAAAATVYEAAPGDVRLAGYVTGGARPAELLAELRRTVPAHLVPATVTVLAALPLTPNGKVDHRALPAPSADTSGSAAADGPGGVDELVAEVWRTVLGVPSVEPTDDFLSLGGHSLAALRVVHLLRRKLDVELQLRHLLDADDLAGFTAAVRRATEAGPAAPRPALTARREAVR
ncbi:non-ribosomal peptide synthetase [Kitasatospora sp. NPDC001574]